MPSLPALRRIFQVTSGIAIRVHPLNIIAFHLEVNVLRGSHITLKSECSVQDIQYDNRVALKAWMLPLKYWMPNAFALDNNYWQEAISNE